MHLSAVIINTDLDVWLRCGRASLGAKLHTRTCMWEHCLTAIETNCGLPVGALVEAMQLRANSAVLQYDFILLASGGTRHHLLDTGWRPAGLSLLPRQAPLRPCELF